MAAHTLPGFIGPAAMQGPSGLAACMSCHVMSCHWDVHVAIYSCNVLNLRRLGCAHALNRESVAHTAAFSHATASITTRTNILIKRESASLRRLISHRAKMASGVWCKGPGAAPGSRPMRSVSPYLISSYSLGDREVGKACQQCAFPMHACTNLPPCNVHVAMPCRLPDCMLPAGSGGLALVDQSHYQVSGAAGGPLYLPVAAALSYPLTPMRSRAQRTTLILTTSNWIARCMTNLGSALSKSAGGWHLAVPAERPADLEQDLCRGAVCLACAGSTCGYQSMRARPPKIVHNAKLS